MRLLHRYCRVAIPGPFRRTFTYHLPDGMTAPEPGQRILVPFGQRTRIGFYLESTSKPAGVTTRPVGKILDEASFFAPELLSVCLWVARYYFANPADCLAAALPSALKSKKPLRLHWGSKCSGSDRAARAFHPRPGKRLPSSDLAELRRLSGCSLGELLRDEVIEEVWPQDDATHRYKVTGYRLNDNGVTDRFLTSRRRPPRRFGDVCNRGDMNSLGWSDYMIRAAVQEGVLEPVREESAGTVLPFLAAKEDILSLKLTDEQLNVVRQLTSGLKNGFGVHLLHGVTGSGKTLVYCHIAQTVLAEGKTALFLTPEIHLSGTVLSYLRGFFGDKVTIMHSAMTERERLNSWRGVRSGRHSIVVGPRSAVFAPLENIGFIVVDEEHDGSYKQDDPAPRFHGRDVAIVRARTNNIPILLGSASPSIESYYNATNGRYQLLELTERPAGMSLPKVKIVDMRSDRLHGDLPFMSYPLKKQTEQKLKNGEQVILYLNRRGYSPQVKCVNCGRVPSCPHCDVSLTYHKAIGRLICHYCEYRLGVYDRCSGCGGTDLLYPGAGTQKVEEALPRLFDQSAAVRFDSDTASGRMRAHRILKSFGEGKYNLLLGTQMVTKGLDLSGVTLVGVLSADLGLDMPDFRASEKTFARLLQVAGRAGRSAKGGDVIVQTYYPDSEVIGDAARQDYPAFYEREIESRKAHNYPPFVRLVNVVFSATERDRVSAAGKLFRERLAKLSKREKIALEMLGPAACSRALLRKRHRRHLLIKTNQVLKLLAMLTAWENDQPGFGLPSGLRVAVDVDPDDLM